MISHDWAYCVNNFFSGGIYFAYEIAGYITCYVSREHSLSSSPGSGGDG